MTMRKIYIFLRNHLIWIINQKYDFSFNNRELALIILFIIFITWALSQKKIRNSIVGLVKALFNNYFNRIYIEIIIYSIFIIHLLYNLNLWDFIYMKDTIIWVIFSATYLSFRVADHSDTKTYRGVLIDTFSVTIIFEFLYNVYTFSLIVEIIIIAFLIFIGIMIAFTEVFPDKDDKGGVNKFFNWVQTYIGISILIFLVKEVIMNYQKLFLVEQLKAFMLPIILTIVFIPYLVYLVAWTTYDLVEVELRQNSNLNFLQRLYFRIRIRVHCKMNKDNIIQFKVNKKHLIRNVGTWREIESIFKLP